MLERYKWKLIAIIDIFPKWKTMKMLYDVKKCTACRLCISGIASKESTQTHINVDHNIHTIIQYIFDVMS